MTPQELLAAAEAGTLNMDSDEDALNAPPQAGQTKATTGTAPDAAEGYRFSKAMRSPGFIGVEDIRQRYLPAGFSHFKIEGRGLGSALVLEFLLYYMTKPEYQLQVRETIYLDNMLDLF